VLERLAQPEILERPPRGVFAAGRRLPATSRRVPGGHDRERKAGGFTLACTVSASSAAGISSPSCWRNQNGLANWLIAEVMSSQPPITARRDAAWPVPRIARAHAEIFYTPPCARQPEP
jgi:hypothetical protein